MKIVFLNRFDRKVGALEQNKQQAQVFIGEKDGLWTVGWRFVTEPSEPQSIWYEGVSWEQLLVSFRLGVAGKMMQGFRPFIDGMLEETSSWEKKPALPQILQCYADQQQVDEQVNALRTWRREKAAQERKSAYLIATNRELQLLAVYLPQTIAELEEIPGFGKVKIDRYGEEIVAKFQHYERDHTFPLADWVPQQLEQEDFIHWFVRTKKERYEYSLSLSEHKQTLLAGIRKGRSLNELQQEFTGARRQLIERIEKLHEEGYDVLPLVEQELKRLPIEEREKIEAALDVFGDKYLKPLLHQVYGEQQHENMDIETKYERLRMMRMYRRRKRKIQVG